MLDSLDVVIGVTVIMLTLSMAVTVVTQFLTTVVNSRGWHLRRGLADLLGLLDSDLKGKTGVTIATAVLKHPLVSASHSRLGTVVHREEFTRLVLGLVAGGPGRLEAATHATLAAALERNGIANPDDVLRRTRELALQIETADPTLASSVRQNMALLREAKSDFVAKVNGWFDQSMDRVSQRFTASTRAVTFAAAFIIAAGLQVDTIQNINRLSVDDELRAALVQQGQAMDKTGPQAEPTELDRKALASLAQQGLITLPTSDTWLSGWTPFTAMGVLITTFLLSLGAPFWYNALGKLLKLRPALASKDDEQRRSRQAQSTETSGAATPATTSAVIITGERGDLSAAG
jgi:hypothetical protein